MTPEQEVQRYIATGEHDCLHATWPGRNILEQMHAGEDGLRAALIEEVRRRTAGRECPSLPPGFAVKLRRYKRRGDLPGLLQFFSVVRVEGV